MPKDLISPNETISIHSSLPRLHATPPSPLPFLRGVVVRSFVLERAEGNVIVYHSPGVAAAPEDILALGRPAKLLVNHWHEAMFDAPYLDVPIFVHEADAGRTEKLPIAVTFSGRETIGGDLEIIPTPGHTPGTTMFLWTCGDHRLLFPGDAIWVDGGERKAVPLGDREAYLASFRLVMELDFDVLVPWGSEDGAP